MVVPNHVLVRDSRVKDANQLHWGVLGLVELALLSPYQLFGFAPNRYLKTWRPPYLSQPAPVRPPLFEDVAGKSGSKRCKGSTERGCLERKLFLEHERSEQSLLNPFLSELS